ncbi:MAG: hypothetical protein HY308_06940 [Gammaproteobacteria bacterium]|nr:hypothetical protein [Gammaproteobacteria bacterium]
MATTDTLAGTIVRCPACLAQQRTIGKPAPWDQLRCPRCRRDFEFRNALPFKTDTKSATAAFAETIAAPSQTVFWVCGLLLTVLVLLSAYRVQTGFDGPEFLVFYFFALLLSFLGTYLLRFFGEGDVPNYLSLLIFEGIGVERLLYGLSQGMSKFFGLFVLMVFGFFFLTARTEISRNWNSSNGNSSGGCGGGCGSSSCGGGCGGCGG